MRGQLPCDLLLVGEAPGQSENTLGYPFVGDAGAQLDNIIKDALSHIDVQETISDFQHEPRIAMTNIVCCIPWNPGGKRNIRPPNKEEIKSCKPNLLDLVRIAQPNKILRVGRVSASNLPLKELPGMIIAETMPHPSAILINANTDDGILLYNKARDVLKVAIISAIADSVLTKGNN